MGRKSGKGKGKKKQPEPAVVEQQVEEQEESAEEEVEKKDVLAFGDDSEDDDDLGVDDFGDKLEEMGEDSEDSDSDGSDMEAAADRLDKKRQQEEEEGREEMARMAGDQEEFELPDRSDNSEVDEDDNERVLKIDTEDVSNIYKRIQSIIGVLANFREKRQEGKPREHYVDQIVRDMAAFFGYDQFLIRHFLSFLSVPETLQYIEAQEKQRPLTIRTNTLKARRRDLAAALIAKGVNLEPIKWSKVGLQIIESQVPIGATPEYLTGQYMIQSASSFCPVAALAPLPGEKVLDMCACPGGKTTYLAAMMKNTGTLVANDVNKARIPSLIANLSRMGVTNAITTCLDGKAFPKTMGRFDRVLLDAPCTGLGVISRDNSIKTSKDEEDLQNTSRLQRELLLAAIDSVNAESANGGIIVYSTCSVSPEENERVVNYALGKRHVKLIDTGLQQGLGKEGMARYGKHVFDPSLKLTRRYYPHVHNMDGFYVAKLKKFSNTMPQQAKKERESAGEGEGSTPSQQSGAKRKRGRAKGARDRKRQREEQLVEQQQQVP